MFKLNTKYVDFYRDDHKAGAVIRHILLLLYLSSATYYLIWRSSAINLEEPIWAGLLYFAELYFTLVSLLFIICAWRIKSTPEKKAPKGLNVDIFVPSLNEPVSIVRRTLLGALAIEYPHKTWLLDDGDRPEMKALAQELSCEYLAREENINAKAGNLNHAMQHSNADFIAFFDADHVAERTFLDRTLGYFDDPKLAFVQTPQGFYNIDSFEHTDLSQRPRVSVWEEQALFYRLIHPGKDRWNGMFFCGCSGVIRRSALNEIGGFVTTSPTEDFHTALKIHQHGHKSMMVRDTMAYGIGATQIETFLKQRFRWMQGNLLSCAQEKIPFSKGLTFMQRMCYSNVLLNFLEGWMRLIFYMTPPLVLLFGFQPIITKLDVHLIHLIPFLIFAFGYYLELGRGYARIKAAEEFAMAKFYTHIKASFGLLKMNWGFTTTSKVSDKRFAWRSVLPQFFILAVSVFAVVFAVSGSLFLGIERDNGLVPIASAWALLNAYFAWLVIHRSMSSYQNDAEHFDFEIPLPMNIHGKETVTIDKISSQQLSFQSRHSFEIGQHYDATLFLPTGHVKLTFTVEGGTNNITAKIIDIEQAAQDRLDLTLHNCTWHRILLGQREYVQTPFHLLYRYFSKNKRREFSWELFPYKLPKEPHIKLGMKTVEDSPYYLLLQNETHIIPLNDFSIEAKGTRPLVLSDASQEAPSGLYLKRNAND